MQISTRKTWDEHVFRPGFSFILHVVTDSDPFKVKDRIVYTYLLPLLPENEEAKFISSKWRSKVHLEQMENTENIHIKKESNNLFQ
jgi:hypothetical protein